MTSTFVFKFRYIKSAVDLFKKTFFLQFGLNPGSNLVIPSSVIWTLKSCNLFPKSPNKNPSPFGVPTKTVFPEMHLKPI